MVFVSYSRKDKNLVYPVVKAMRVTQEEIFLDVDNLKNGEPWNEQLEEAIKISRVFALFWSATSSQSEVVAKEWRYALDSGKTNITPIILDRTPLPDPLKTRHGITELSELFKQVKLVKKLRSIAVIAAAIVLLVFGMGIQAYFNFARAQGGDTSKGPVYRVFYKSIHDSPLNRPYYIYTTFTKKAVDTILYLAWPREESVTNNTVKTYTIDVLPPNDAGSAGDKADVPRYARPKAAKTPEHVSRRKASKIPEPALRPRIDSAVVMAPHPPSKYRQNISPLIVLLVTMGMLLLCAGYLNARMNDLYRQIAKIVLSSEEETEGTGTALVVASC